MSAAPPGRAFRRPLKRWGAKLQCEHWEKDDEGGCEEDREMGQQ